MGNDLEEGDNIGDGVPRESGLNVVLCTVGAPDLPVAVLLKDAGRNEAGSGLCQSSAEISEESILDLKGDSCQTWESWG